MGGGDATRPRGAQQLRRRQGLPAELILLVVVLVLPREHRHPLNQQQQSIGGVCAAAAAPPSYTLDDFLTAYQNPNVSYHEVEGNIMLTESLPPLTRPLTLVGKGLELDERPVIDGADRYKGIVTDSNITLINLKFRAFRSNTSGAALSSTGDFVNIDRCVFRSNLAINGTMGGASGAAINMEDSFFSINNTFFYDNYAQVNGGAIRAGAVVKGGGGGVISGCVFEDNEADENGGAAHFRDLSAVMVHNCKFLKNEAQQQGGALFFSGGLSIISQSEFTRNTAEDGVGGAVRFYGDDDQGVFSLCGGNQFDYNTANTVTSNNVYIRIVGGNVTVPSVYFCGQKPPETFVDALPSETIESCDYC